MIVVLRSGASPQGKFHQVDYHSPGLVHEGVSMMNSPPYPPYQPPQPVASPPPYRTIVTKMAGSLRGMVVGAALLIFGISITLQGVAAYSSGPAAIGWIIPIMGIATFLVGLFLLAVSAAPETR